MSPMFVDIGEHIGSFKSCPGLLWSPRVWSLANTVGQFQVLSRTWCQAYDFCSSRSGLVHFCQSEVSVWRLFVSRRNGRVSPGAEAFCQAHGFCNGRLGLVHLFQSERSGFEDCSSS